MSKLSAASFEAIVLALCQLIVLAELKKVSYPAELRSVAVSAYTPVISKMKL